MKIKSIFLVALLFLCLALALGLSVFDFVTPQSAVQLWRGYYTLIVPGRNAPADVQGRLARSGLSAVTGENTRVSFDDFSSQGSVPVARLAERFDPVDPRYDPYMKELPSYFHSGGYDIYYVRSGGPPPITYLRLARALRGLQWKLADFKLKSALMCFGLWMLVVLFVLFRSRRSRVATFTLLAGMVPWISVATSGSYTGVLAASLIYLGWSVFVEVGHPALRYYLDYRALEIERWKPLAGVTIALLFSTSCIVAVDPRVLAPTVRGITALLALGLALIVYEVLSRRYRQHRLFFPLRISDRSRLTIPVSPRVAAAGILGLLLLASPAIVFLNRGGDVEIPVPLMYPGVARTGWAGLARLWAVRNDQGLPDMADYVAHRAFQAGLSYGRGYSFPTPNEKVYESQFKRVGNHIVSSLVPVRSYSERWLKRIMQETSGIMRIIQEQPGTVLPMKRRLYSPAFPVAYFVIFWLAMIVVLLPSTFARRERAFEPIGRLDGAVTVVPRAERIGPRRLPERPSRVRRSTFARSDRYDLVPEGVREGD